MNKCLSVALAATLAMATGACQQPTAQQLNATNANSRIYLGALTCNVSGSTGFVFGSTKSLNCVYLTKDGVSQAYSGNIRKFGIDLGFTKDGQIVWHVFQLGALVGAGMITNPAALAGNYAGEQASVAANSSAGGNWLYGGSNNQIVLQATQIQDSRNAGYNLAYGIAEMSLTPGN
jgi:Protein of unknown function (DUF992)